MNDEFFNKVKKQMELFAETDRLNANISDAVKTVNDMFQIFGIQDTVDSNDIEFSNSFLWNKPYLVWDDALDSKLILRKPKLSEIIFNHYYPKPTSQSFYHFTTYSNFVSIIKNQELWLFNLMKRFQEGEFRLFYKDHGLTGYETNTDDNGVVMERALMQQTFYTSFAKSSTIPLEDEENLWYSFGEGGLGVRLEFEITPKGTYTDFRNVFYKQDEKSSDDLLINKLVSEVNTKYKRIFTLSGLSKIGGFYLQGDFDTEHEARLLIKQSTDDYKFDFIIHNSNGEIKYIKLKLFDNPFVDIKIKSVQPGFHINDNRIEKVLEQYPLPDKPEIKDKPKFE